MDSRPALDAALYLGMCRAVLLRHIDNGIEQGVFLARSSCTRIQIRTRVRDDIRLFIRVNDRVARDLRLRRIGAARNEYGGVHDLGGIRSCCDLCRLCLHGSLQILMGFRMDIRAPLFCFQIALNGHVRRALCIDIADRHRGNGVRVRDIRNFDFGCGCTRVHGDTRIRADRQRTIFEGAPVHFICALGCEDSSCPDLRLRLTAHDHVGGRYVDAESSCDFRKEIQTRAALRETALL